MLFAPSRQHALASSFIFANSIMTGTSIFLKILALRFFHCFQVARMIKERIALLGAPIDFLASFHH
jgi:hypothetical protein